MASVSFVPLAMLCRCLCIAAAIISGCARSTNQSPTTQQPVDHELQLRDGFEGQSLATFWRAGDYGSGRYAPGAITLADDRARSGRQSAKITLHQGDIAQVGDSGQANERAELDSGKHAILNSEVWYGFSFLVPQEFPIVFNRLVIAQWKQSGRAGSPVVAQRFVGGQHYLTIRDVRKPGNRRTMYNLPKIVPGQWNDMVYRIRFAHDSSGVVEVWMNGERVVEFEGTTASTEGEEKFYHKIGLYRDRMAEPMTIYVDNYAVGGSFDAVDPVTFDDKQ